MMCPQVNEIKASVKFQLKKVLCMGVAIGNVAMEEKEVYVNTQVCMHALLTMAGDTRSSARVDSMPSA